MLYIYVCASITPIYHPHATSTSWCMGSSSVDVMTCPPPLLLPLLPALLGRACAGWPSHSTPCPFSLCACTLSCAGGLTVGLPACHTMHGAHGRAYLPATLPFLHAWGWVWSAGAGGEARDPPCPCPCPAAAGAGCSSWDAGRAEGFGGGSALGFSRCVSDVCALLLRAPRHAGWRSRSLLACWLTGYDLGLPAAALAP